MLRPAASQFLSLALIFSLIPNSVSAAKFPDYPVRPASEYSIKAERSSLTIGIQPLEDPAAQKTYFHTKLTPKGFLPVLVVIQNAANAQDSFIFDTSKASLTSAETATASATGSPQASYKAATVTAVVSGVALSFVGLMISAGIAAQTSEINDDLLLRELRSTTLSPGASAHGFLYIPIPKDGDRDKIHLKLPMLKSGTDETVDLDVVF